MELGAPLRIYTVEPIEDPLPAAPPDELDEPPRERRQEEPADEPALGS